ncbi:23S rRNA (guanosine(2251)-2'-O)-methyltransferase RlmB [Hoyosella altamirensis]|uniref:23S rRNA (Guanosine2251-2'-O)-methyltransferase n=1 Tax=Hoyosella altamirensis TaxID=616997 RepID=A0A839RNM1_9ACTN|nr:23S rRNA (guanosine(2251)-2'-O)-methyltransferase RlmB [Hoyosella altamirensis]MBB3037744.1 23S rRNA (guanosine2251-2'-O)-methyltransferase [Hoyosella altamirensis]
MAGNSRRQGAVRKAGSKKGATKGSGGKRKRGLSGRGATPPAEMRVGHPAARRAAAAARLKQSKSQTQAARKRAAEGPELVLGRNPVVECLRAGVPATALFLAVGNEPDERVTEAVHYAGERGISILEVPRGDLDKMTTNGLHQGVALQVPPYQYAHPEELVDASRSSDQPGLVVALDNITDPRNLGAVIRSTAAFGGNGVLIPERRSASVTAVAWRTSAGAAARVPVARATNLTRALKAFAESGYFIAGLDSEGAVPLDEFTSTDMPLVLVVGSEGKGLSRLVKETCDVIVSVPMAGDVESLNASVAAGVVLADIARQRRRSQ